MLIAIQVFCGIVTLLSLIGFIAEEKANLKFLNLLAALGFTTILVYIRVTFY